jgi:hypothetical protein
MMKRGLCWAAVFCALLMLTIVSSPVQGGITDDLFAYWNMDGNLAEAIDSDHDGTLIGISGAPVANFVEGKFGQAIDLDRADAQRVEITGDDGAFRFDHGTISISTWFTVENFDEGWQALIAKGEGDSWRVARHGSDNVMSYAGGSGDIPVDPLGPDVADGEWHNLVAITENEVSTRLWVDGELIATNDAITDPLTPTIGDDADRGLNPMQIGGNPDDGDVDQRSWNGNIDDVAIWTRAITPEEVGYLWNDGAGNAVVPEPTSLLLAALGLLALGLYGWQRRK